MYWFPKHEKNMNIFRAYVKKEQKSEKETGQVKDGSRWWYRHKDGRWYFFDENGYMVTGWIKNNGKHYQCEKDGKMLTR